MSDSNALQKHRDEVRDHILSVAHELAEKKQLIKLDRLYNICRQDLRVPSRVITEVIDQLVKEKAIVPGSRLIRKELFNNPLRQEIFALIGRNPGLSFSQLRKKTSRGTKILLWHVEVLTNFGYIFEFRTKRRVTYFPKKYGPPTWSEDALRAFVLFQDKRARSLFTLLLAHDSLTIQAFHENLKWPRQTIQYQLAKLDRKGFVDKFLDGNTNYYFLISTMKRLVQQVYDELSQV